MSGGRADRVAPMTRFSTKRSPDPTPDHTGPGAGSGAGSGSGPDSAAGTEYDDQLRATRATPSERARLSKSLGDAEKTRELAVDAARLLRDDKCENIVVLDVRDLSEVTDYIVIASGTSDRQMNSSLDDVKDLGEGRGWPSFKTSSDDRSTWLLVDFVDVVVHLFEPNTRAYYDLEMMWGDADRVAWRRAGESLGEADDDADA